MAPKEKLEKISEREASTVDISDVTLHKTIKKDSFFGSYAVYSIAKMAYELYCYTNNIEEFKEEYKDIVDYILRKNDGDFVDIIIDGDYYYVIDQLSEIGTNAFFQYDDVDGYRYVVFDFWKTIAYRVRICKSPDGTLIKANNTFDLYLYHIDESKSKLKFCNCCFDGKRKSVFATIKLKDVTGDLWREFVDRIGKILSTMVLSINILKREVDDLSSKLKKYDAKEIDMVQLLGFEENRVVTTVEIICQLYFNKDKYDMRKSFNQNLPIILNLKGDTILRTEDEKIKFLKSLEMLDKENKLSEYMWNGINVFNEIYENERNLTK